MTTENLTAIYTRKQELQKAIYELDSTYKENRAKLVAEIQVLNTFLEQSISGLDTHQIGLAETVIYVRGSYAEAGEARSSVIRDAINDLAINNGKKLQREYFGTKSYAHWHGQRSDHPYGYGPRHGSVIFMVGLVSERQDSTRDLTAEEIEAAIYYLTHLERIQSAKEKAAA